MSREYFSRSKAETLLDRSPIDMELSQIGWVRLKYLSGAERVDYLERMDAMETTSVQAEGILGMALLLTMCMIDENGDRIFDPDRDVDLLTGLYLPDIRDAADRCMKMNGFRLEVDAGKSTPSPS